jgi:dolichol-phosphate mannosyltransferase
MKKTVVIVPTYNERENIGELAARILGLNAGLDLLIIDDNSPDGTGQVADGLAKKHGEISVMHRPGKAGLGKAYIAGFNYAIGAGYDNVITMDADFSHDPKYLPEFLEKLEHYDVVVGTRYIRGGGVRNWPWYRKVVSRGGSLYTRLITGMPLHDATGGFNGYRRKVLEAIHPENIRSEGYASQLEMKFRSWKMGFRLVEVPIVFVDRTLGRSKMSRKIFLEAVFMVLKLRFGCM